MDKNTASRHKGVPLHARRNERKEEASRGLGKSTRILGVALELARLTILEDVLVTQSTHVNTPFAQIANVSNPGLSEITQFPALQYWFEMYRTTKTEAIAGVLRLTQEVLFGSNIISSRSIEAEARRECYGLAEEVEERIAGFMPTINSGIEVIFPIHDVDAAFTQIEETGLFTLTIMWSLTWQLGKGAKS